MQRVEQKFVRLRHVARDRFEQRDARLVGERAQQVVPADRQRDQRSRVAVRELRQLFTEYVADRRAI